MRSGACTDRDVRLRLCAADGWEGGIVVTDASRLPVSLSIFPGAVTRIDVQEEDCRAAELLE